MNKDSLISLQTKDLKLKTNVNDIENHNNNYSALGVFEDIQIAIDKAIYAQRKLITDYTKEDREKIITVL